MPVSIRRRALSVHQVMRVPHDKGMITTSKRLSHVPAPRQQSPNEVDQAHVGACKTLPQMSVLLVCAGPSRHDKAGFVDLWADSTESFDTVSVCCCFSVHLCLRASLTSRSMERGASDEPAVPVRLLECRESGQAPETLLRPDLCQIQNDWVQAELQR